MSTEPDAGTLAHARSRDETGQLTERITFRATRGQIDALEALVESGAYPNRSAAIRVAVGQLVASESGGESDG